MAEHISSQFNQELETVRTMVMKMGGLVEQQLQNVIKGLEDTNSDLLQDVVAADRTVNEMEVSIDDQCQLIIARRQPAAGDLRLVLTVTRIITDLERIGDEVKKIALYGNGLISKNGALPHQFHDLNRLAQRSLGMIHTALDAFARLDATVVVQLNKEDDLLDHEYDNLLRQQITYMMEDPRTISTSLDTLFMFKAIERIGDHASDIAEIIPHLVTVRKEGDPAVSQAIAMGRKAYQMIQDAMAALTAEDELAARKVIAADDAVDFDFNAIKHTLAQEIAADPAKVDAALDLLMVIKYLERIGDHAVNVAEWVQFVRTGRYKDESMF